MTHIGENPKCFKIFSAKEDFEEVRDSEEDVEDVHISEVESDYEDFHTPSPPPPPPPPPPIEIEEEDPPVEEEEEEKDIEEEEEEERQPSAKSTTVGHIVPHRERFEDQIASNVIIKKLFEGWLTVSSRASIQKQISQRRRPPRDFTKLSKAPTLTRTQS